MYAIGIFSCFWSVYASQKYVVFRDRLITAVFSPNVGFTSGSSITSSWRKRARVYWTTNSFFSIQAHQSNVTSHEDALESIIKHLDTEGIL